jgi:hypothetical protein
MSACVHSMIIGNALCRLTIVNDIIDPASEMEIMVGAHDFFFLFNLDNRQEFFGEPFLFLIRSSC